jgi:hypothetical protein
MGVPGGVPSFSGLIRSKIRQGLVAILTDFKLANRIFDLELDDFPILRF